MIDPLTADLLRDQQGGSFLQGGGGGGAAGPLPHGLSARRGSLTSYGANVLGGMPGLARDSQQLQGYYASTSGVQGTGGGGGGGPHNASHMLGAPSMLRNTDAHCGPGVAVFGRTSGDADLSGGWRGSR